MTVEVAFRKLIATAHELVEPYAGVTDAQLEGAANPTDGRLAYPISPELARLVLGVRAALRAVDWKAGT
ncbi:MAG TPA: hypothetical protein VK630_04255 [Reyranella sp.]|nr:hypothetical protein [Reyranella sp.]